MMIAVTRFIVLGASGIKLERVDFQVAQFHFVEDYERHIKNLMSAHPLDEAMSLAVGGGYDLIGAIASDILIYAGAKNGMSVLDFGCGSGRVAHSLAKRITIPHYLGTDVVQPLLDYAATKTPGHFKFVKHQELSIPAEDGSFNLAYAFSVFTHLLQAEIFIYLTDIARVLKPKGTLVFSFLEFAAPAHWVIFDHTVAHQRQSVSAPLNMFMDRIQIEVLAKHAGFKIVEFIDSSAERWSGHALGQSIAILEKID
ncbi:MAG TPA: class I SAM-dependent methyltransferase [Alphaproteobacteria bacterium]|nr:class I SAM-dependent methyltransferase [Alphaproteobacteria bacterium]